jgi:hypothetical protein
MAIGLIAIIGMIPQGVQSSRAAADNTLVATIVHDTFNDIRRKALSPPWPPSLPDVYYDAAGTNIPTQPQDRYFHIKVTSQPGSVPNLLVITATLTWPDKGTAVSPLNSSVFVTQIANYQQ